MNYKFKKWQKKMICSLYGDRVIFDQNDEMRDIKGRSIEYPDACEQFGIFEVRTTEQMGDLKLVDKAIFKCMDYCDAMSFAKAARGKRELAVMNHYSGEIVEYV